MFDHSVAASHQEASSNTENSALISNQESKMSDSDSVSESNELNLQQDEEWQDVEADTEDVSFTSLFDNQQFSSITAMLEYCRDKHNLDIWKLRKEIQLGDLFDALGCVQLRSLKILL